MVAVDPSTPAPSRLGPIGLSLPNRAVLFGAITMEQMLTMVDLAEDSGYFDSLWVGDSLIAKARLESITLLAALAGRTQRMWLGPACMASFPLRHPLIVAQQWATLDYVSGGRTVMVPCIGGAAQGAGGHFASEYDAFGIERSSRMSRMEEGIEILKRLWTEDDVSFEGEHFRFEGLTLEPKPLQDPRPPIWIASDPGLGTPPHLKERAFRRVARISDGWMTSIGKPDEFRERWGEIAGFAREYGRDPEAMHTSIHHMVCLGADRAQAYDEAKRFLDTYYETDTPHERMEAWVSYGSPEDVADNISSYLEAGVKTMILRFASWDPIAQIEWAIRDVLPRVRERTAV